MKSKEMRTKKTDKSAERKGKGSGDSVQLTIFLVFFMLGVLIGFFSIRVDVRAALLSGFLLLYVMYRIVSRMDVVEKDEIKSNTILPYLASWYASWVFLYNYLGMG